MSENAKTCINCNREVDSNFCPDCGQKTKVLPITWKGLIKELSSRWLGLDNKIARTFTSLWIHPKKVIEGYLEGNRVKYIGPLSYLVVMSALYIFSFSIFGVTTEEFLADTSKSFQPEEIDQNQQKFMQDTMGAFAQNMRLMVGALIPFMALSLIIFYEKRNYLQNFLVISYLTSQMLWLSILAIAIFAITGYNPQFVGLAINITYYVWVIGSINPQENKFITFFKAFWAWVIGYIFFMIVVGVLSFIYAIVLLTSAG